MYIYYKQKEKDDLAKVEAVNEIICEVVEQGSAQFGTRLRRRDWYEVLSGAVTFTEAFINAYMNGHFPEAVLIDPNFGTFAYSCPKEVQDWAADIAQRLGEVRFRTDVLINTMEAVAVSAAYIKRLYPRWYTVEIADLTKEQIEANQRTAADCNLKEPSANAEAVRCKMARAQVFVSTPRPGYRQTLAKDKADGKEKMKVTFTELDYYQDMAKRKLHL